MDPRKHLVKSMARIFSIVAVAAFMYGCGQDRSPLAVGDEADLMPAAKQPAGKGKDGTTDTSTSESSTSESSTTESSTTLSNTTESSTTETSTTDLPLYSVVDSGTFYPDRSGYLNAKMPNNYGSWDDVRVKEAIFEVEAGALDAVYDIGMRVTTGYTLDDVLVEFAPAGLVFIKPARLTLKIWWGGDLSPEQLAVLEATAEHITADGTVTYIGFETTRQGNAYLNIIIEVPGFSRYGLSGDGTGAWGGGF